MYNTLCFTLIFTGSQLFDFISDINGLQCQIDRFTIPFQCFDAKKIPPLDILIPCALSTYQARPETRRTGGDGRVVRRRWVNFQCRGVLLIWTRVGKGPIALAVGAGGVVWTYFLSSIIFLFFLLLSGRRPEID